jgi:hypothetical protein
MVHDMGGGAAGALMTAAMIVMMLVMGGFSLAFLSRTVPAAWRAGIQRAARRPARLPGTASKEGAR